MKPGKLDLSYILAVGLAITFLSNSLSVFLKPDEFSEIIAQSLVFNKILDIVPFFATLVGINDLFVCILLISRLFPKIAATWATIWISGVVIVFLSQASLEGMFAALEHGAPLGIAIYLALRKQPVSFNQQVNA